MPQFEVKGIGKDSSRKRKRVYFASTEIEACQLAEGDGTIVEEVIELPPEPPTEPQLAYASDLGISIPENATKSDVSDLISRKVDGDKLSSATHRNWAREYGLEVTNFIGKKALFDRMQAAFVVEGREKEMLGWFAYRVYRELVGGDDNAPIRSPSDPIIQSIAGVLEADAKVVKSARRYEGRELIWFGEWTSPDGLVHTGGSNRTAAYKAVAGLLKDRLNLSKAPSRAHSSVAPRGRNAQPSLRKDRSLLPVVIAVIVVLAILVMIS